MESFPLPACFHPLTSFFSLINMKLWCKKRNFGKMRRCRLKKENLVCCNFKMISIGRIKIIECHIMFLSYSGKTAVFICLFYINQAPISTVQCNITSFSITPVFMNFLLMYYVTPFPSTCPISISTLCPLPNFYPFPLSSSSQFQYLSHSSFFPITPTNPSVLF